MVQKICGEIAHPPTGLVYFVLSYFNRLNKQKNQESTVGKNHKKLSVDGIRELRVLALVTLPCRTPSSSKGQGSGCPRQPLCSVFIFGRQDTLYAHMQRTSSVPLLQERQRACPVGWDRLPCGLKRAWLVAAFPFRGRGCCCLGATSYLDVSKEKEKPWMLHFWMSSSLRSRTSADLFQKPCPEL